MSIASSANSRPTPAVGDGPVEPRHGVGCSNGTAAIHLALHACGVTAGDTVLVSDFTFIATANPVRYLGAQPIFVDSETASWNLDPARTVEALEASARAGRLPRAVLAVHILGQPADLGPIVDACARVPKSARGEYELPEAVGLALREGVPVRAVRMAASVLDLSRRSDIAHVVRSLALVEPRL